jgi:hypothetical protein
MLRSVKDLEGCAIGARDGTIGHVDDLYFDDEAWVIRYLVVDTGAWLVGRDVLISPYSVGTPDWGGKVLPVTITREQVKHSPPIETEKPVSRQHEMTYLGYYGYPYYWGGGGMWGTGGYPGMMLPGSAYAGTYAEDAQRHDDPHLRSCNAVKGYHIHATDGEIGHVQGYLVDERSWAIQYLVIDTSNWWLGHQVLVAPQWALQVSWTDSKVSIDLDRKAIQGAPVYDPTVSLSRDAELGLHRHYGRTGYWRGEDQAARAGEPVAAGIAD